MSWKPVRVPPYAPSAFTLLAFLVLAPTLGWAEQPSAPAEAPAEPPVEPPDAPRRRTGWDFQGMPILNFNTDDGAGYGALVITAGNADKRYRPLETRILVYRMDSRDPGVMMPELGRSLIHEEGLELGALWPVPAQGSGSLAVPDTSSRSTCRVSMSC